MIMIICKISKFLLWFSQKVGEPWLHFKRLHMQSRIDRGVTHALSLSCPGNNNNFRIHYCNWVKISFRKYPVLWATPIFFLKLRPCELMFFWLLMMWCNLSYAPFFKNCQFFHWSTFWFLSKIKKISVKCWSLK